MNLTPTLLPNRFRAALALLFLTTQVAPAGDKIGILSHTADAQQSWDKTLILSGNTDKIGILSHTAVAQPSWDTIPILAGNTDKSSKPAEASRVRFLIVADSDAKEGSACALDGGNLKVVLEAGLDRQKLEGRYTIDVLTGADVAPARVLKYYEDLKVGADETLVFYYSGHGAFHSTKGHLLTFSQGDLPRSSVLAAMQSKRPRLAVVLTDCCAILDDAAPPQPKPAPKPTPTPKPKQKRPIVIVPARSAFAEAADAPASGAPHPPRPKDYVPPSAGAKKPATVIAHPPRPSNYRPPPPFIPHPDDNVPGSGNLVLRTADGPLALKTLLAQTSGEVMRHLFYRHTGLVDINACEKGKAAFATTRWGGGLFTITLLTMQKDQPARFDTNRNGMVEWSEFFAALRTNCERTGIALTKGGIHQVPQAHKLGQPVLQIAGH